MPIAESTPSTPIMRNSINAAGLCLTAATALHRVRERIDRCHTTVEAAHGIHQAEFRELILGAYNRRCAVSNLPVAQLLQAAHTIPDRDRRGRREVTKGLCLSTLQHRPYHRNLLGIDADGTIHIAESVLAQYDRPTLEAAIKE